MIRGLYLFFGLALTGTAVHAETWIFSVDPEKSHIEFLLTATFHNVHGKVPNLSGSLRVRAKDQSVQGKIEIPLNPVQTGNKSRDKDMHIKVLETEKFPLVTFIPQTIQGNLIPDGTSEVVLRGTMQIHGVEHLIEIPLQAEIHEKEFHAKGAFVVPYVEWGMTDPSSAFLRVGKKVDVTLDISGSKEVDLKN